MRADLAEWLERDQAHGARPRLACKSPVPTPGSELAWLWVFRADPPMRLTQRWAGELTRPERDEMLERLRERHPLWLGRIHTPHAPPSRRFRLVWTLPPAPCLIYTRRGLAIAVEPAGITRHFARRSERIAVKPSAVVEGWIGSDWIYAGLSLKSGGEESVVLRLKNAGLFEQFLLMYDGIDLMLDTAWLDGVVPRVAEVLGSAWRIVDYTETPPKLVSESETASAPGGD